MLGLKMVLIALTPFAVSVFWGLRVAQNNVNDGWLVVATGAVGTAAVLLQAYVSHCVKREDGEDDH